MHSRLTATRARRQGTDKLFHMVFCQGNTAMLGAPSHVACPEYSGDVPLTLAWELSLLLVIVHGGMRLRSNFEIMCVVSLLFCLDEMRSSSCSLIGQRSCPGMPMVGPVS